MKKIILNLFLFLAFCGVVQAQFSSPHRPTFRGSFAADPSTCTTPSWYWNTLGSVYKYCSATNTWSGFGGGGSTSTLSGATNTQVQYGAANGSLTSNANFTASSTVVTVPAGDAVGTSGLSFTGYTTTGIGTNGSNLTFYRGGNTEFNLSDHEFRVRRDSQYAWSFSDSNNAASDTGLSRSNAALVKVTNGSTGFGNLLVATESYGAGWSGSQQVPTKADLYTKIEAINGAAAFVSVTGTTQTITDGGSYGAFNNSTRIVFTLPATCTVGKSITVNGFGSAGWKIAQNSGQQIHGNTDTTAGATGYVQSQARYDSVSLKCMVANTDWIISNSQGTLTLF